MSDQPSEMFPNIVDQRRQKVLERDREQSLADQQHTSLLDAIQAAVNNAAGDIDAKVQEVLTAFAASYEITQRVDVSQSDQQYRWEIFKKMFRKNKAVPTDFCLLVTAQLIGPIWDTDHREFFLTFKPAKHPSLGHRHQPHHDLLLAVRLHEVTNWPVTYESEVDCFDNYKHHTAAFPQVRTQNARGNNKLDFLIGWPEKESTRRKLFQWLRPK